MSGQPEPSRRTARVVAAVLLGAVLSLPAAASAQTASPSPRTASIPEPQDQVVLSGTLTVPKGLTVGEVVVFHGRAIVTGAVNGDVVVLDGPIAISGAYITGNVVALNGPIRITGTAQIGGDVLGAERVRVDPGVKVGGQVREQVGFTLQQPLAVLGVILGGAAIAISVLLMGLIILLVAPRGAERVASAVTTAPFASAGWGVLLFLLVPVAALVLTASILGLPLGLSLILALALAWLMGLAWTAVGIGRAIVRPPASRWGAFLAGWAVVAVVGVIPFVNAVSWGLGAVFGLGAMAVAIWRARGRSIGKHRPGVTPPVDDPVPLPAKEDLAR